MRVRDPSLSVSLESRRWSVSEPVCTIKPLVRSHVNLLLGNIHEAEDQLYEGINLFYPYVGKYVFQSK